MSTIAGFPARPDPGGAEIDVLGVVLAVDRRRQQPHDVHAGQAAIARQFAHLDRSAARVSGMRLASSAMTCRSRWICFWRVMWLTARLEYWMSFCRFSTCQMVSGSGPCGFQMCTANTSELRRGYVVEHRLDRRVRQDAAVPIELAVDADRRKGRRQRAGRHHVADAERHFAAVEIAHLGGPHVGGADRQPRRALVDAGESTSSPSVAAAARSSSSRGLSAPSGM